MRVLTTKLRVEIENETRVFLESLNFDIEMRVSLKSASLSLQNSAKAALSVMIKSHSNASSLYSMERFLDLIQLFFWVLCSALFFPNVFVTMRTFFRWETIQTVSHKAPDTPVRFPSIVVCSKEPFKDPDRPMLTLQEFEENTYNDQEFVITLNSTFHNGTTTWTNSTWNSVMKGRCMVLDMDQSVSLSPFLSTLMKTNLIEIIFDRLKNSISLNTAALD